MPDDVPARCEFCAVTVLLVNGYLHLGTARWDAVLFGWDHRFGSNDTELVLEDYSTEI